MGARYQSNTASGYNSSPPSDNGAQTASNLVKWSTHKTKLTDPIKTLAEDINTDLVTAFDYSVRQITSSDSTVAGDHMRCVEIAPSVTAAITVSLGDAATMGTVYRVYIKNSSARNQTIGRATSGDTIDGSAANVTIPPGGGIMLQTNATPNGYLTIARHGETSMILSGQNGSGVFRTDSQLELQNFTAGQHVLLSLYQDDETDEGAVTFGGKLSNSSVTQLIGNFVRFVNGDNTWNGAWQSVWGVHNVGGLGADNQTILSYGNNSVWLATGPTSDLSWNVLPQANSVSTGNGTTTNAGVKIVNGLVSGWGGIGAENLTLSSTNYSILIKNDGSALNLNAATGGSVAVCINNSAVITVGSTGGAVTGNWSATSAIQAFSGTATPAGGAAGTGLLMGSAGVGVFWGSGAPTMGATRGSLYLRTDNGANTSLYVNRDGGTTWAAVTSA